MGTASVPETAVSMRWRSVASWVFSTTFTQGVWEARAAWMPIDEMDLIPRSEAREVITLQV